MSEMKQAINKLKELEYHQTEINVLVKIFENAIERRTADLKRRLSNCGQQNKRLIENIKEQEKKISQILINAVRTAKQYVNIFKEKEELKETIEILTRKIELLEHPEKGIKLRDLS